MFVRQPIQKSLCLQLAFASVSLIPGASRLITLDPCGTPWLMAQYQPDATGHPQPHPLRLSSHGNRLIWATRATKSGGGAAMWRN